jgi:hypothetical protein
MDVDEAVAILRAASPHGWVEIGTDQPEPAPLRETVSLATPAREPRANEASAVVLAGAALAAERDAARREVERWKGMYQQAHQQRSMWYERCQVAERQLTEVMERS